MKHLIIPALAALLAAPALAAEHEDATVNEQVTDSVTQTDTEVLGESPAMATGETYESSNMDEQGGPDPVCGAAITPSCPMDQDEDALGMEGDEPDPEGGEGA